jgi:hypothetical protein
MYATRFPTFQFIQISSSHCEIAGYHSINFIVKKKVTAWEKGLYYFNYIRPDHPYNHIWFMEDDVFFHSEATLNDIERLYPTADLLSNIVAENTDKKGWHWEKIDMKGISPPYYCAMVCAMRASKKMLQVVHEYATQHSTLFFLEALFPTLAKKENIDYRTPPQFQGITYRNIWTKYNTPRGVLFHPVKTIEEHAKMRLTNCKLPI